MNNETTMSSKLLEQLHDLGEQRHALVKLALHPEWQHQFYDSGAERDAPAHPAWIHSPWFEEWKRLAGIAS